LTRDVGPFDWQYYLTWEGRIGPGPFFVGGQVVGVAGLFAALPLIGISMFSAGPGTAKVIVSICLLLAAALAVPGSSLLVRRGHDFGWPAALSLTICLVPGVLLAGLIGLSANCYLGIFEVPWLKSAASTPAVISAFLLNGFLYFWLALKKGQPKANRYGAALA